MILNIENSANPKPDRRGLLLGVFFTLLAIDLTIRYYIVVFSRPDYSYTINHGYFAGLFSQSIYLNKLYIFLGLYLLLTYLLILFLTKLEFWNKLIITVLSSGLLTNYLERFFQGSVTDYLTIKIWNLNIHFNIADIFIFLAVTLGGIKLLFYNKKSEERSYFLLNLKDPIYIVLNLTIFFTYIISLVFLISTMNFSLSLTSLLQISFQLFLTYLPMIILVNAITTIALRKHYDKIMVIERFLDQEKNYDSFHYRLNDQNVERILKKIDQYKS